MASSREEIDLYRAKPEGRLGTSFEEALESAFSEEKKGDVPLVGTKQEDTPVNSKKRPVGARTALPSKSQPVRIRGVKEKEPTPSVGKEFVAEPEVDLGDVMDKAIEKADSKQPEEQESVGSPERSADFGSLKTRYYKAIARIEKGKVASKGDREWAIGHTFKPETNQIDTNRFFGTSKKEAISRNTLIDPTKDAEVRSLPSEPLPEPPPLPEKPKEYDPYVQEKMKALNITPEILASFPVFETIKDSDAKVAWMLERFDQVRLKRISNEAKGEVEKDNREKGKLEYLRRIIFRSIDVEKKKRDIFKDEEENGIDIAKYGTDLESLIHLSDASPDMRLVEKDGKTSVLVEYAKDISGISPSCVESFNQVATDYAKFPPKYDHKRLTKEQLAEFKVAEERFYEERDALLETISQHVKSLPDGGNKHVESKTYSDKDAMRIVNDAEFSMKMHQTLASHPSVEIEFKKLAESGRWNRAMDTLKAQFGTAAVSGTIGTIGARIGLRYLAKSSLAAATSAIALPVVLAGIGGFFGGKRGAERAEEQLRREEELMRLGFEDQTHSRKFLPKLNAAFEKRRALAEKVRGEINPKRKEKLEKELRKIDENIVKLKGRGTDQNIAKADTLTQKIAYLEGLIGMEYVEYINTTGGRDMTVSEFKNKKKEWTEKLEVRLEYTKQKLDEGKISFGKEEGALGRRLSLLQSMGSATARLVDGPDVDERVFMGHGANKGKTDVIDFKTRRGELGRMLKNAEARIQRNQKSYIKHEKWKGVAIGAVTAGIGYEIGHWLHGAVVPMAHDIQEKISGIKASDYVAGKMTEDVTKGSVHLEASHGITDNLAVSTPSSSVPPTTPTPTNTTESFQEFLQRSTPPQPKHIPEIGATLPPQVPEAATEIPKVKPYELTLTNETQSREYALIKYYEAKGLSHADAGKKAHEIAKGWGPKGERSLKFVHKGDKIMITEKDGKPFVEVVPKDKVLDSIPVEKVKEAAMIKDHQIDEFTGREIGVDSAERAVTRLLRVNADEYGFMGDVNDKAAVKEWAAGMTKEVIKHNPELSSITHDGDTLELVRTPDGKWFGKVNPSAPVPEVIISENPQVAAALESYEVTAPTNLISVTDKIFSSDPRYAGLNQEGKDKFLLTFLLHYADSAEKKDSAASFFKSMNIASGNPLDIPSGKINLDAQLGPDVINRMFKEVEEGKLIPEARNLSAHLDAFLSRMKEVPPEDITRETILSTLKGLND